MSKEAIDLKIYEEELKTLNDLRHWDLTDHGLIENDDLAVEIKELKAEAIKWVKNNEKGIKFHQENLSVSGDKAHKVIDFLHAQIEWIKHFFNLTKEDLK